jgi:hypothetical protein
MVPHVLCRMRQYCKPQRQTHVVLRCNATHCACNIHSQYPPGYPCQQSHHLEHRQHHHVAVIPTVDPSVKQSIRRHDHHKQQQRRRQRLLDNHSGLRDRERMHQIDGDCHNTCVAMYCINGWMAVMFFGAYINEKHIGSSYSYSNVQCPRGQRVPFERSFFLLPQH